MKDIIKLLIGRDPWAEKIHENKNLLTREVLKTQNKIKKVNSVLSDKGRIKYHKDTAYYIARGMNLMR